MNMNEKTNDEYFKKYDKYYDFMVGNFAIPTAEFTIGVLNDTLEFIKRNREYFILFCSHEDGYEEDFYCVTNFLY